VASSSRDQRAGLLDRAREAVEQEAVASVVVGEALDDHADHDRVGHQLALVHVLLGRAPELGAGLARGAQDVAGRDVREAEILGQQRGLRALAGAGRTQQDQIEFGHREVTLRSPRRAAATRCEPPSRSRWSGLLRS
jgi:hypothetical protein